MSVSVAGSIAGMSPLPVRATLADGAAGSLLAMASVADPAPAEDGLYLMLKVRSLPAGMDTGKVDGATGLKSAAFGPETVRPVMLSGHVPVLLGALRLYGRR